MDDKNKKNEHKNVYSFSFKTGISKESFFFKLNFSLYVYNKNNVVPY